jgi:type VI secretion system protein ImpK
MASRDDPFGLDDDRGRTRIRPPQGAPVRHVPPSGALPPLQPRDHPNPLIGAFAALLAFAPELESATAPSHLQPQREGRAG